METSEMGGGRSGKAASSGGAHLLTHALCEQRRRRVCHERNACSLAWMVFGVPKMTCVLPCEQGGNNVVAPAVGGSS